MAFDLLTTVEYGGCSAKLPAAKLAEALKDLPKVHDPNLLVDIETHDDAGVYRLTDDLAIIQTTDFFPPVCSDPFEFGQIAAANALSDIYAMGGQALTAMNIVLFPSTTIPLEVLADILRGGQDKVAEAGAVIVGGHTIDDTPPKYGLAVTGTIHPGRIITNAAALPGNRLILTKPLGTGIIIAGARIGEATHEQYRAAIESMKLLNRMGAIAMQAHGVKCATDITGFGFLGHALKMAIGSGVTFRIDHSAIALLPGVLSLADLGCLPGACFRNQEFVEQECFFAPGVDYSRKMCLLDAQTSGGLLIAAPFGETESLVEQLKTSGYPQTTIIGDVVRREDVPVVVY